MRHRGCSWLNIRKKAFTAKKTPARCGVWEGAPELRQVLPPTVVLMTRRRGSVMGDCGLTLSLPTSSVQSTRVIFFPSS